MDNTTNTNPPMDDKKPMGDMPADGMMPPADGMKPEMPAGETPAA